MQRRAVMAARRRDSFTSTVSREIGHYVYRLIDPRDGSTFYVGRGQGNRVFAHANADRGMADREDRPTEKLEVIHDIRLAGLEPIHVVHRHGIPESAIGEVEAALIDAYQGLTNLVTGEGSAKRGPANAEQLEERYGMPRMVPDPEHRLVLIRTMSRTVKNRGSLYEAVRKWWPLRADNANKTDFVLAIVDGVCVGVFGECEWIADGKAAMFTGVQIHSGEIADRYLRKRPPEGYFEPGERRNARYWSFAQRPVGRASA